MHRDPLANQRMLQLVYHWLFTEHPLRITHLSSPVVDPTYIAKRPIGKLEDLPWAVVWLELRCGQFSSDVGQPRRQVETRAIVLVLCHEGVIVDTWIAQCPFNIATRLNGIVKIVEREDGAVLCGLSPLASGGPYPRRRMPIQPRAMAVLILNTIAERAHRMLTQGRPRAHLSVLFRLVFASWTYESVM